MAERVRISWLSGLVVAAAVVAVCGGALAASQASRGSGGIVAGNGPSKAVAVSSDFRVVAFVSNASNLVARDRNGRGGDLFLYDRAAGKLQRVDVGRNLEAGLMGTSEVRLSPDFRFVAFSVTRPGGDVDGCDDLFIHDRLTGKTEQVDVSNSGAPAAVGPYGSCSAGFALSPDGRFVAFGSPSANLVARDTTPTCRFVCGDGWDVFVRDRATHTTERVSVSSSGGQGNGDSSIVGISPDGRLVYFSSEATNLTAGAKKGGLFVHDRLRKTTRRVPIPPGLWNGHAIPGRDRFVPVVVEPSRTSFYVLDRVTGKRALVRVTKPGTHPNSYIAVVAISANGRYVVFDSSATNLAAPSDHATCVTPPEYDGAGQMRSPGYRHPCSDLYVTDRATGRTARVNARNGRQPDLVNGGYINYGPAFVGRHGRFVVFTSRATNLVPGRDANHSDDIFLSDTRKHTTTLISAAH